MAGLIAPALRAGVGGLNTQRLVHTAGIGIAAVLSARVVVVVAGKSVLDVRVLALPVVTVVIRADVAVVRTGGEVVHRRVLA